MYIKYRYERMVSSLSRALWDSDLIASRVTLALAEFFWAIMLLWVGDTFDRPTYHHMASVMGENHWGLVFLVSAYIQLSIVMFDQLHSFFARIFAFWNMVLWVFTVISMVLSIYPPPAAIGGEIALACSAVWIWIRPYILAEGYKRAAR